MLFVLLSIPGFGQALLDEEFETTKAALATDGWLVPAGAEIVPEGRDGSKCLRMACPEHKGYTEIFLPVERGRLYRASAWIKCEDVGGDPASSQNRGAVLFCQFADSKKGWVGGGSFPKGLHGTRDWRHQEVRYTSPIPENVAFIQLMIGIEGVGRAWFDDVMVEEITSWDEPKLEAPADGAGVSSLRPLLKWDAKLPTDSYEVQWSRDPAFSESGVFATTVWGGECRPRLPLSPGQWHWRSRTATAQTTLPWTEVRRFLVPGDAITWPPFFEPRWTAQDTDLPSLEAVLAPASWVTGIEARVGDIPCKVRRSGENVTISPQSPLPRGIHDVVLTIEGANGRREILRERFVNKRAGTHVTLREDGILLVDGNPFFPLGAYRDPSDTLTDFSGLHDLGFNTTHSYVFEEKTRSVEQARAYLQAADKAGVKVFLGFSRPAIRAADRAQWADWVAGLMDEPALLTWYMMDEPICQNVPPAAFADMLAAIRRYDGNRPASQLLAHIRPVTAVQRAYAGNCDILWCDPYPIPARPLSTVRETAEACRDAAGPGKPFWVVLQAHDLRYWRGHEKDFSKLGGEIASPTPEETRCMAHLALATGAHGLIWYWGPKSHYHMQQDAKPVWEGLRSTLTELRELVPWLVARRSPRDVVALAEPFRGWSRSHDGTRVLAVVNESDQPARLELSLPARGVRKVRSRDTGRDIDCTDGVLGADFAPWQVRLYEWSE